MQLGIIELASSKEVSVFTGVSSRRGIVWDKSTGNPDKNDLSACEIIYLMFEPRRTIVQDIVLPAPLKGKFLENALQLELEDRLPVPFDEIVWAYRELTPDHLQFRVLAMHVAEQQKVLDFLAESDWKCDELLPVQLIRDSEESTAGQGMAEELRQYWSRWGGANWISISVTVPSELKPVRYRNWKWLYLLFLSVGILMAAFLLFGKYQQYAVQMAQLKSYRKELTKQWQLLQLQHSRLAQAKELVDKLEENQLGSANPAEVIAELAERLPKHMWSTSFEQVGRIISVTVSSEKDDLNLYKTLGHEAKSYQLVNLRKTRGYGDKMVFYIKLKGQ